jgi:hypothetical protein
MKIAVMQPYFFPYIGYWQLMSHVDVFVLFDDAYYIKKGFVDRNVIKVGDQLVSIKLEVVAASQNKLINQLQLGNNRKRLLKTISQAYRKAPFYEEVSPLIEHIFDGQEDQLSLFLRDAIVATAMRLGIKTDIILSSDLPLAERGKEKIVPIAKLLGATDYVNMMGGRHLYDEEEFKNKGISLSFLSSNAPVPVFGNEARHLSIIDLMMTKSSEDLSSALRSEYSLAR